MSVLAKLKAATTLHDLAAILGYQPKALAYLIYKLPPSARYTQFSVPKKSGGVRVISAPEDRLRRLQRHLSKVLYQCREEIEAASPKRSSLSHGFRKAHSIITNAKPHIKRRHVLNLDIEDFFPSFNFGRVRGFFIRNNDFKLHPNVATIIAQIACHNNELPQGAPTSPIISDLIAHLLDIRLVQLAKANTCSYSRYADDITFSTNLKTFPADLASPSPTAPSQWELGTPLVKAIQRAGFTPHPAKTRMHSKTSRQAVTGLTVNRKVNIEAQYYRRLRSMAHAVFSSGSYFSPGASPTTSLNLIGGMMTHVFHVKRTVARARITDIADEKKDTGVRRLYRTFLFFKYFVALNRPLLVCEGKTDNIFLKLAIRKLFPFYPAFGAPAGKTFGYKISFFNHSKTANEVMKLGGGVGGMQLLVQDYKKYLKRFTYLPLSHPVILLVDNDTTSIFDSIKKAFGVTITLTSTAPFYHLGYNLYLVKTPELGAKGTSCIESFFDPSVLKVPVDGKTFNPAPEIDTTKEYGKVVLAEKVVRPNAGTIDFSQFGKILDRIAAVLSHYKPPSPAATAPPPPVASAPALVTTP
ncbi:RNA-directed DNA polymerase [Bradyrhizobium sp. F1.13.1]